MADYYHFNAIDGPAVVYPGGNHLKKDLVRRYLENINTPSYENIQGNFSLYQYEEFMVPRTPGVVSRITTWRHQIKPPMTIGLLRCVPCGLVQRARNMEDKIRILMLLQAMYPHHEFRGDRHKIQCISWRDFTNQHEQDMAGLELRFTAQMFELGVVNQNPFQYLYEILDQEMLQNEIWMLEDKPETRLNAAAM